MKLKRQTILLVIMLLLVPIAVAVIVRSVHIHIHIHVPELRVSVQPSPAYPYVVLPCFLVALVVVVVAQYRNVRSTVGIPTLRLLAYASCSVLSGIVLFVVYPAMWRCWWILSRCLLGSLVNQVPAYAAGPLLTVANPIGGIVLVVLWCALQPVFLHSISRRSGRTSKEKALFEISFWFFTVFSWYVLLTAFGFPLLVLATMPHGGMCK